MIQDPLVLNEYSKEELIRYILMVDLTPKMKQLLNAVEAGDYNTRYLLGKVFGLGVVDNFIKLGLTRGFLKRDWVMNGKQKKAVLSVVDPLTKLHIKATEKKPLVA